MARFGNSADPTLRLKTTTGASGQLQYVVFPARRTRISPTEYIETSKQHVLLERSLDDGTITTQPLNTLAGSERFFQPKYTKRLRISFAHSEAGMVNNPF